jgi:hypothetical protein
MAAVVLENGLSTLDDVFAPDEADGLAVNARSLRWHGEDKILTQPCARADHVIFDVSP